MLLVLILLVLILLVLVLCPNGLRDIYIKHFKGNFLMGADQK